MIEIRNLSQRFAGPRGWVEALHNARRSVSDHLATLMPRIANEALHHDLMQIRDVGSGL